MTKIGIDSPWLPTLVVADLVLLPMLQIGPVPFKFSFLVILLHLARFFPVARPVRHITLVFSILLVLLSVSWAVRAITSGQFSFNNGQSMMASFALAPLAFAYGWSVGPRLLKNVPWVMVVYFVASLIVILFWTRLIHTFIGDLYFYQEGYLGYGAVLQRPGGLHQSPHITALFMTILSLFLVIGVKYRFLKLGSPIILFAVGMTVALALLVGSRSEMLSAFFIVLYLGFIAIERRIIPRIAIGALITLIIVIPVIAFVIDSLQYGSLILERLPAIINDARSDPLNRFDGIGRFFHAWVNPRFLDAFTASPIIGAGPEGKAGTGAIGTAFHNDFASIVVAGGLIGISVFMVVLRYAARASLIMLVPFAMAGMSNAFVLAPQHFVLFMLLLGIATRMRAEQEASPAGQSSGNLLLTQPVGY